MTDSVLLSTAYFPPIHYMALIHKADRASIEREENYQKQTYRNRCTILTANGIYSLTVPVLTGSFHKQPVKDIRIDYTKRWQQLHLRGLKASYASSPFYEYYIEDIESIILKGHNFLLDLNMDSLNLLMELSDIRTSVSYTDEFVPAKEDRNDFRYLISPKKTLPSGMFTFPVYPQVFNDRWGFTEKLSTLDLLFNTGPDCPALLNAVIT